jgi:hypothetical protein
LRDAQPKNRRRHSAAIGILRLERLRIGGSKINHPPIAATAPAIVQTLKILKILKILGIQSRGGATS